MRNLTVALALAFIMAATFVGARPVARADEPPDENSGVEAGDKALLAGGLRAENLYAGDGTYDFFGLARYPEGGKLVDGVELYEVKEGGGPADEYTRRVVRWWPRKGVDFIEIQEGMIDREWIRKIDFLDEGEGHLAGEPEIFEHDELMLDRGPDNWLLRRFRGYLHPPEDGDYTFKISADDMGFFYVSTDDRPGNKKLVAHTTEGTRLRQWNVRPSQISVPVPMQKGRKYYYEVIHYKADRTENVAAAWQSDQMAETMVGGPHVSTLDGERGKVIEELWRTPRAADVRAHHLPRAFRAHLIGFDGIGNAIGDPHQDGEDFVEPTAILRMPDGTPRGFEDVTFRQEDREFILDVYRREMERVKATLDKTEHKTRPGTIRGYPNNAEIGEPGTMRVETDHFVVPSGTQGRSAWINTDHPERAARFRESALSMLSDFHAYLEYGGHLMPYWDRKEQYRFEIHVGGTIADGYRSVGGGGSGGYGAAAVALGARPGGFAHEYGHGFSIQWRAHSGEILPTANTMITGGQSDLCEMNVERPYRNPLHGTYVTTLFLRMIGFDPNWGMVGALVLPKAQAENSFYQTLARVGQQRGLFEDGIRGVGDLVGDYGARQAEFDVQIQEGLRTHWFAVARNYLEPVDPDKGVYRIPWDEAPEPFGVNIVRLLPAEGEEFIEADFEGYHDPAVYSDWRACLVAVDRDGRARYSDLWNKGTMRMARREGDLRYWLTVAGTPRALMGSGRWHQGHHAPRFPWQVTLRGAVPGSPHRTRADLNDVHCVYGRSPRLRPGTILPVIPNTATDRRFVKEARAVQADLRRRVEDESVGELEKIAAYWVLDRLQEALGMPEGAPHPNGGGWVAATAEVAPTAYVGPHAAVLEQSRVLDHAIIEDYAVIRDNAVISEHARVSGQAVIGGGTRLEGYHRAWFPLSEPADGEPPELTTRLNAELDAYGLWANYAMEQPESIVLEDLYRGADNDREFFVSVLNGYLHGRPEFFEDGERRGFAFDGETQYAELNRRIADLGELTVDMTVKWQGNGDQTLLAFGSGEDNRFTLTTGGQSGRLVFLAKVDGEEAVLLSATRPLPHDQWTRVRLEIDGDHTALWMDDEKVAEKATSFRPAHVFKPGRAQRNLIASGLDGSGKFKGIFENFVIYHRVHGQAFASLPRPVIATPRRPEPGFAARARTTMTMSPYERQDRAGKLRNSIMTSVGDTSSRAAMRLHKLKHRSSHWPDAVAEAAEIDTWREEHTQRFNSEFDESPQATEWNAQVAELAANMAAKERELRESRDREEVKAAPPPEPSGELAALDARIREIQSRIAEVQERIRQTERETREEVDAMPESEVDRKEIARVKEQIAALKPEADAALKDALARHEEERTYAQQATKELQDYATGYWRAVRPLTGALGGWWGHRVNAIKERLKIENAAYRQWAELTGKLEKIEAQYRYRHEAQLLRHIGRAELQTQADLLGQELRELSEERKEVATVHGTAPDAVSPEEMALQARLAEIKEEHGTLRRRLGEEKRIYVQEKMRDAGSLEMDQKRERVLAEGRRKAMLRYYQEDIVIWAMIRSAHFGFYNMPYDRYVRDYARESVGEERVRIDGAEAVEQTFLPANWMTSADQWDWRTPWEVGGSIAELPLTQKWLERVRGATR